MTESNRRRVVLLPLFDETLRSRALTRNRRRKRSRSIVRKSRRGKRSGRRRRRPGKRSGGRRRKGLGPLTNTKRPLGLAVDGRLSPGEEGVERLGEGVGAAVGAAHVGSDAEALGAAVEERLLLAGWEAGRVLRERRTDGGGVGALGGGAGREGEGGGGVVQGLSDGGRGGRHGDLEVGRGAHGAHLVEWVEVKLGRLLLFLHREGIKAVLLRVLHVHGERQAGKVAVQTSRVKRRVRSLRKQYEITGSVDCNRHAHAVEWERAKWRFESISVKSEVDGRLQLRAVSGVPILS